MSTYFSCIIPFAGAYTLPSGRYAVTEWHPTEATGPFSVLSRGAFRTVAEAHAWAKEHLDGFPYSLRAFAGLDECIDDTRLDTGDYPRCGASWAKRCNIADHHSLIFSEGYKLRSVCAVEVCR